MEGINLKEVMEAIPDHFIPENAKGIDATVQCKFSGSQNSDWIITIKDQTCIVEEGISVNPDITVKADTKVIEDLINGELDPMRAFLFGKVKIKGELSEGMKLVKLFQI